MKKMLFCITLISLLSGCSTARHQLTGYEGTWILQQQSGGFAGMTIRPEKESLLVIGKGIIERYENGILISKEPFKVEKAKVIQSTEPQDVIATDRIMKQSVSVTGDTLILTDQCYDCYSYLYIKKR